MKKSEKDEKAAIVAVAKATGLSARYVRDVVERVTCSCRCSCRSLDRSDRALEKVAADELAEFCTAIAQIRISKNHAIVAHRSEDGGVAIQCVKFDAGPLLIHEIEFRPEEWK